MKTADNKPRNSVVRLRLTGDMPVWPNECVVCGTPCAEKRTLRSYMHYRLGNGGGFDLKIGTPFMIPVHTGCKWLFRFSTPIWVHLLGFIVATAFAYGVYLLKVPDRGIPWNLIVIGFGLGWLPYGIFKAVAYPSYVRIQDLSPSYYVFRFKDSRYRELFASLNKDSLCEAEH